MKIKNNKGVTLTVLVITIIVMLILFNITFSTSTDLLKNSQKNKMKTMLYMVQSRAEILLDDYLFDNENEDLSNISDDEIQDVLCGTYLKENDLKEIKNMGFETGSSSIPNKNEKIYCSWNEDVLKSQGIDTKNLAKGDTIIIQYDIKEQKVDVASTKGFSNEGIGIHKLSDF